MSGVCETGVCLAGMESGQISLRPKTRPSLKTPPNGGDCKGNGNLQICVFRGFPLTHGDIFIHSSDNGFATYFFRFQDSNHCGGERSSTRRAIGGASDERSQGF